MTLTSTMVDHGLSASSAAMCRASALAALRVASERHDAEVLQVHEVKAVVVLPDGHEQRVRREHVAALGQRLAEGEGPLGACARPRLRQVGVLGEVQGHGALGERGGDDLGQRPSRVRALPGEVHQCPVEILDGRRQRRAGDERGLLDRPQLGRRSGDGLPGPAVAELGVAVGAYGEQDQRGQDRARPGEPGQQPAG